MPLADAMTVPIDEYKALQRDRDLLQVQLDVVAEMYERVHSERDSLQEQIDKSLSFTPDEITTIIKGGDGLLWLLDNLHNHDHPSWAEMRQAAQQDWQIAKVLLKNE